jgi:signal transduction histidine kinase
MSYSVRDHVGYPGPPFLDTPTTRAIGTSETMARRMVPDFDSSACAAAPAWQKCCAITSQLARSLGLAVAPLAGLGFRMTSALRARRFNRQIDGVLAERLRLARELHDTLLQVILGASMQLEVAVDRLQPDDPAVSAFNRVSKFLCQAADDGRDMIGRLRMDYPGANLEQALLEIPRQFPSLSEVEFRITVEGTVQPIHPVVQEEIYWIGREAVLNALRHSNANSIHVELRYGPHEFTLSVRDDGGGMEPQIARLGRGGRWGIRGMRERAARILSQLNIRSSQPGGGTEVELCVPARIAFHRKTGTDRLGGE